MDPEAQGAEAYGPSPATTSLMFNPLFHVDGMPPDIICTSVDNIAFHVHYWRLAGASSNSFGGTLTQVTSSLALPETSTVLNIIFHVLYGMSCLSYQPLFEAADAALAALIKYGVTAAMLSASQVLHELLMSYAPYRPIDVYALAAHHGLENIAVAASAHLLAYDVLQLSDALTIKMGPVYFSRLCNLQRARLAALKNIIVRPPAPHPLIPGCTEDIQREIRRAWAFANAQLIFHALPNTSIGALQTAFAQAGDGNHCPECHNMLRIRIAEVTSEWAAVKRTI